MRLNLKSKTMEFQLSVTLRIIYEYSPYLTIASTTPTFNIAMEFKRIIVQIHLHLSSHISLRVFTPRYLDFFKTNSPFHAISFFFV